LAHCSLSWLQLVLLPEMSPYVGAFYTPFPLDSDGDSERESRSDSEWFNAVASYLEFRAGSGWRRGRSKYRNAPRYLEYLDAIRLLHTVRYEPHSRIEPVIRPLSREIPALKTPWIRRPWDHFRSCGCASCRSLRMRGIDPASTRPAMLAGEDAA
jgi:hypothetical protein